MVANNKGFFWLINTNKKCSDNLRLFAAFYCTFFFTIAALDESYVKELPH